MTQTLQNEVQEIAHNKLVLKDKAYKNTCICNQFRKNHSWHKEKKLRHKMSEIVLNKVSIMKDAY